MGRQDRMEWHPAVSTPRPLNYPERSVRSQENSTPSKTSPSSSGFPPQASPKKADALLVNDNSGSPRNNAASAMPGHVKEYPSAGMTEDVSTPTSSRSTVSSIKACYLFDSSSKIMGDFIPIEKTADMSPSVNSRQPKSFRSVNRTVQITPPSNPYEFELTSPPMNPLPQTKITDFVWKHDSSPAMFSTPRMAHFKNARSDGNVELPTQEPSPHSYRDEMPNYNALQRSGSSPQISSMRFAPRNDEQLSPNIPKFAEEYGIRASPSLNNRHQAETTGHRGRQHIIEQFGTPTRSRRANLQFQHCTQYTTPLAETRHHNAAHPHVRGTNEAYDIHGYDTKTPTERGRFPIETPSPTLSLLKRSRSPMKKLFGERGFFGQGLDEPIKSKADLQSLVRVQTENESAPREKKAGIMDRLKNKFGEITEKADMTPRKSYGSSNNKSAKVSLLSISLTPPEQARILMEVELMLVHTANSFLMVQFSQGRMLVDSIKKTVDTWKGKGRPTVIEFMYDQATQRDLVAANEHEFHFHGARAGHIVRIDSMLYNWKQVAALMSIRTFCSTDTVILKLLFDVEQILELLGAGEAIMLRVQQIRAKSMELMRLARQSKDNKTNSQQYDNGGEEYKNHNNSSGGRSGESHEGLYAVPDQYREHP